MPGFAELAALVAREVGRWSTVNLKLPFPDDCHPYLTSPAPLLRKLSVTYRGTKKSTAPVALFGGSAPALEVLKVNGVRMDWTASFFHGLRELSLSRMSHEEITPQQILEILAGTPLLEELRIRLAFRYHRRQRDQPPQGSRAIIHLPNLKAVSLRDIKGEAAGTILSSLRAPNCTRLKVEPSWVDGEDTLHSFPEPALSHFKDFQRRAICANQNSKILFFDRGVEWESRPGDLGGDSEFNLLIPYSATAVGVEWVARVIGVGAQELVHSLEMTISHERFAEDHFAAYRPISRCQSVTKLKVNCDHPSLYRPILELLGNWHDSGDGARPLPGFPRLEVLGLRLSQASWLDDLEVLVDRRFGEREDVVGGQVPSLEFVVDMWGSSPGGWVDMARLQRLRAANGVGGITRLLDIYTPGLGMLAAVYDDDAGQ